MNINIQEIYLQAIESLRGSKLNFSIGFGIHRPPKNSISPSQFTVKNPHGVIKQCFEPELLEEIGFISRLDAIKIHNSKQVDLGGLIVMSIGTGLHEVILPAMEKHLRNKGINAICELPLVSRKLAVNGTCDFVIIDDHKKTIQLFDMKTGSIAILKKRNEPSYSNLMKIVAYANILEDIYDGYQVTTCNILYAQTSPKSKATYVEYDKNGLPILDYDQNGIALLQPEYLAMSELYSIDFEQLKNMPCTTRPTQKTYQDLFLETVEMAHSVTKEIKAIRPSYNHWILDEKLYETFIDSIMEKLEARGVI